MQATILVVDDTPSNISVLMEILGGDYRVLAAINGEQALKIAREIGQQCGVWVR